MPSHTSQYCQIAASKSDDPEQLMSHQAPDEQELYGNQAILDRMAQGMSRDEAVSDHAQELDQTGLLFIGMGDYARKEATALHKVNADKGGVKAVYQRGKVQDELKSGGEVHTFHDLAGCLAFASGLGLPEHMAVSAAELILEGGKGGKDEVAQIVDVFAQAELGNRTIDRIVLSGHSESNVLWGDHNGTISFQLIAKLCDLFPNAAGQVKHLMISACYCGGDADMMAFREMFPNVESIWGYHESGPGTRAGAIPHLTAWEGATDEEGDATLTSGVAAGTRKVENVSTWTEEEGYSGKDREDASERLARIIDGDSLFLEYLNGGREVLDAGGGPLRQLYSDYRLFLSDSQADPSWLPFVEERANAAIRLLYWNVIRGRFSSAYANVLVPDFKAAGIDLPRIAQMTRGDFVRWMDTLELERLSAKSAELLEALLDLYETEIVQTGWI